MANEKRLIDANAFLKSLEWECGDVCEQTEYSDYLETEYGFSRDAISKLVQNAPTVDAVELPPIKVGDTAYFIINRKIYKAEVYYIRWEHHKQYGIHSEISASVGFYSSVGASFDDFGKTVFLTEAEAKAALAKMEGGIDK